MASAIALPPKPMNVNRFPFFRSLRVRLLLTLLFVVSVAIGVTTYFAREGTTDVIDDFVAFNAAREQETVVRSLQQSGKDERLTQSRVEKTARSLNVNVILVGRDGIVQLASDPRNVGQTVLLPPDTTPQILYQGKPLYIVITSAAPTNSDSKFSTPFSVSDVYNSIIGSINQSFLLAASLALLLAILLSIGLSRRILKPVEALTAAARQMESGDLNQRVPIKSNDEIGELASAFNAMATSLERTEQLRRQMVSDVAHELRTPLANVRGYLEALMDGALNPTPEVIRSVHEEAMLLNRLIDDLQDLALIEAGQLTLERAPTAVDELIASAVAATQPQALEKGVSLYAESASPLPLVEVDPVRIGQVLRNLIANAIRHTPRGGEVGVAASAGDDRLKVSVRDTGEGIAPDQLPYIFERFYRADPSRTRADDKTQGSGLGLTIVKQLVEAHGGGVQAQSEVGKGTTLTFTLPLGGG